MSKILITGASGLIGTRLSETLSAQGHEVFHLGRSKGNDGTSYLWNVEKKFIEPGALEGKDVVIHLAGAGIADQRWTEARKKEILESRTKSTELLFQELKTRGHSVRTVIAASAIGYYGFDNVRHTFTEDDGPGSDYLSNVVKEWEEEQNKIQQLPLRLVKIRIGIVLSTEGGALKEIMKPVKLLAGSPLGSGEQFISWIHIDDLCAMFLKAISDEKMTGTYNGVGPYPVTNRELTTGIARVLKKPLILPPVPPFMLKLLFGEMADLVLRGSKVSSEKIQKAGFSFKFNTMESALDDLIRE